MWSALGIAIEIEPSVITWVLAAAWFSIIIRMNQRRTSNGGEELGWNIVAHKI